MNVLTVFRQLFCHYLGFFKVNNFLFLQENSEQSIRGEYF